MRFSAPLVLLAVSRCSATRLFAASFLGNVTTLELTSSESDSYTLDVSSSSSTVCPGNPSWITLDRSRNLLFCTERGFDAPNGTLNTLNIQEDGSLTRLDSITTLVGGVASVLYADKSALAVAYYTSSSAGSYDISDPGDIKTLQTFIYTPEVNHTAPHPHDAIIDPTSSFVISPDLGSDLLRIYYINPVTKLLEPLEPVSTPFGSGPRHAEFLVTSSKTYLYVVFELGNILIGYDVVYGNQTLELTPIFETNLLKTTNGSDLQPGSFAAEIHVSPDTNFIMVSQRNDSFFSIPNPTDPLNTTNIVSDSLFTFSVDHSNGHLDLLDLTPAGGSFPRQFSVNKAGDLLAVGLQNDGRVVIMTRNVTTGRIGDIVAGIEGQGQPICLVWDE